MNEQTFSFYRAQSFRLKGGGETLTVHARLYEYDGVPHLEFSAEGSAEDVDEALLCRIGSMMSWLKDTCDHIERRRGEGVSRVFRII